MAAVPPTSPLAFVNPFSLVQPHVQTGSHRVAPASAAAGRRAPVRALGTAAAAALALHAALLGTWPGQPVTSSAPAGLAAPPALRVRQIANTREQVQPAAAASPQAAPPPAPTAPAQRAAAGAPGKPAMGVAGQPPDHTRASAPAVALADPAPAGEAADRAPARALEPEPADTAAPATSAAVAAAANPASEAAAASPVSEAATAAGPEGPPPPTYRTQPAPPATLLFELKRGLATGQAVLTWQPDSARKTYQMSLQAQAFGIDIASWDSRGGFDAAGIAPERYAETRRGRLVRATNFQRAAQKISFSAQTSEFPLAAGVQDRSSWMLQLGAILQANPELALPGAQVALVVVGTRGAPEPWVFTVLERAALILGSSGNSPTTVVDAVHLTREPRRPYDTRASVWLDPARHHLPVKVQLLVHATGEGQEFELRQIKLP